MHSKAARKKRAKTGSRGRAKKFIIIGGTRRTDEETSAANIKSRIRGSKRNHRIDENRKNLILLSFDHKHEVEGMPCSRRLLLRRTQSQFRLLNSAEAPACKPRLFKQSFKKKNYAPPPGRKMHEKQRKENKKTLESFSLFSPRLVN
jgi:hypothetical protein